MIKKEDVFKIGQFAKPHGIKGEIALVTNSDVFDDSDDPYIICEMDGILVPFFIEEYRYKTCLLYTSGYAERRSWLLHLGSPCV